MATYGRLSSDQVKAMARRARVMPSRSVKTFDLAVDYLENNQLDDTRNELNIRYPATQQGDPGQRIEPVCFPLTERYVAEAANAYNKTVARELTTEDGETSDATRRQTDGLNRMLDDGAYDEVMHRTEQFSVLLETCGLSYETARGKLRASMRLPQYISPCRPERSEFIDINDPDDYDGYVLEVHGGTPSVAGDDKSLKSFMVVTNAEVQFWRGSAPNSLTKRLSVFENPYKWTQKVDEFDPETGERTTSEKVAGGRMLTFWHRRFPVRGVISTVDPDIVAINRELNIAWSSLLDTIKMQGFAIPVITLQNKSDIKAKRRYGSRWPLILKIGESFNMATAAVSFTEQVAVLKDLVKMIALLKRQSPNDFSMEANAAESGFAKVVDSIPKIEARNERVKRLTRTESKEAWPCLRAIGISLGYLDASAMKLKMRAKFADVEMPMSETERAAKLETDTRYRIRKPEEIIAHDRNITVEEAEEMLAVSDETGTPSSDGIDPKAGDANGAPMVGGAADIQKTVLNGAQIAAAQALLEGVAAGRLPRDGALGLLITSFQVSQQEAESILGSAGAGFVPTTEEATPPSAAPPPADDKAKDEKPPRRAIGQLIARKDRQAPARGGRE